MAGKYPAPRDYRPGKHYDPKRDRASGSLVALCVTLAVLNVAAGVLLWLQLGA